MIFLIDTEVPDLLKHEYMADLDWFQQKQRGYEFAYDVLKKKGLLVLLDYALSFRANEETIRNEHGESVLADRYHVSMTFPKPARALFKDMLLDAFDRGFERVFYPIRSNGEDWLYEHWTYGWDEVRSPHPYTYFGARNEVSFLFKEKATAGMKVPGNCQVKEVPTFTAAHHGKRLSLVCENDVR